MITFSEKVLVQTLSKRIIEIGSKESQTKYQLILFSLKKKRVELSANNH
jgi:hypothetical protein